MFNLNIFNSNIFPSQKPIYNHQTFCEHVLNILIDNGIIKDRLDITPVKNNHGVDKYISPVTNPSKIISMACKLSGGKTNSFAIDSLFAGSNSGYVYKNNFTTTKYRTDACVLFTNTDYAKSAKKRARALDIALFNRFDLMLFNYPTDKPFRKHIYYRSLKNASRSLSNEVIWKVCVKARNYFNKTGFPVSIQISNNSVNIRSSAHITTTFKRQWFDRKIYNASKYYKGLMDA